VLFLEHNYLRKGVDKASCSLACFVCDHYNLTTKICLMSSCRTVKVWQKLQAQMDKLPEARPEERPFIRI